MKGRKNRRGAAALTTTPLNTECKKILKHLTTSRKRNYDEGDFFDVIVAELVHRFDARRAL